MPKNTVPQHIKVDRIDFAELLRYAVIGIKEHTDWTTALALVHDMIHDSARATGIDAQALGEFVLKAQEEIHKQAEKNLARKFENT